jgi:hypothetical protein
MSMAEKAELSLHRSGLLQKNLQPGNLRNLAADCKIVARHVARIDRWRLAQCNGIPRWDQKAQGVFASWTEEDGERAERETAESRDKIRKTLGQHLTPGCVWKWYTDPRAGVVARISDKANRRDCFLGGSC